MAGHPLNIPDSLLTIVCHDAEAGPRIARCAQGLQPPDTSSSQYSVGGGRPDRAHQAA